MEKNTTFGRSIRINKLSLIFKYIVGGAFAMKGG